MHHTRCQCGGDKQGLRSPEGQGSALLLQDLTYAEHAVEHLVTVPLSHGQNDALYSFVYNEGVGRLQSCTLPKVLNAGNYAAVPAEFLKWEFGGGKKPPGAGDAA